MSNQLKQVEVLSVKTDSFFQGEEKQLSDKLSKVRQLKGELELIAQSIDTGKKTQYRNKRSRERFISLINYSSNRHNTSDSQAIESIMKKLINHEKSLSKMLKVKVDGEAGANYRSLNRDTIYYKKDVLDEGGNVIDQIEKVRASRIISFFESLLTRTLQLKTSSELVKDNRQVNDEVIVVKVFHNSVFEDLVHHGFEYNGQHYRYLSSSSGQLKTKKGVFVLESALNKKHVNEDGEEYTAEDRLTCGLTWDRINQTSFGTGENKVYGVNTNKYLSYLMLANTSIKHFDKFDIDRVLVVNDLELNLKGYVDYIDRDTYKIEKGVYKEDLKVNVTDGAGLVLPSLMKKPAQIRTVWTKGLLIPCDFLSFAKDVAENTIVKDVWGKAHCIEKEGIQILLTSSQLKMWKYYKDWNEFKELFKKYECEAGICNEEKIKYDNRTSYQFLQSLHSISNNDLTKIAEETNKEIDLIGRDKQITMSILGATEEKENKNPLQEALVIYNNLLNDPHVKSMIKNKKDKMVKSAKGGSLKVEGARMFVYPDVYGWMEYLFQGTEEPKGLLSDGKVFSKSLNVGEVVLNRSPQLYIEHPVRENVTSSRMKKWFKGKGIYVSNWDLASRILNYDWDGDELDCFTQKDYVKAAKEHMKGINPLFYKMSTAPVQELSKANIYNSVRLAFGASIGTVSNKITRILNSPGGYDGDKKRAQAFLTMHNNFIIDFSKTLYKPDNTPEQAMPKIKEYTDSKLPHFFQYSKGFEPEKLESIPKKYVSKFERNGKKYILKSHLNVEQLSTVNKLEYIIKGTNIYFRNLANKLDHKNLQSVKVFKNLNQELYDTVVKTYVEINKKKNSLINKDSVEYNDSKTKYEYIAKQIRDKFMTEALKVHKGVTDEHVADILIDYLYREKNAENKNTLWECFGEIILANIKKNLLNTKACQQCGSEFNPNHKKEVYCSGNCKKEGVKAKDAARKKLSRMKKVG